MNNPTVLKGVSITAFIISALFTIFLMVSGTVGIVAITLTVGMAIILEVCKCGFFYESISNTKLLLPIRVLLGVIALLLVGSSIFASASYVQNNANKANATQMKDSSQYKQLEQGKALQQDLYNVKKKEIEDLKALQNKQQANGDSIISSMPKNYIDRRNQAKQDTATQIAKTQDIINSKSTEMSQIGASLQIPIDTSKLNLSSSNGYTAMFISLAEWINSSEDYKSNPVNAKSLEMWFFIGLGVIFEFVAVLTAYLSQLKNISTSTRMEHIQAPQSQIDTFKHNYRVSDITSSDNDKPNKRTIGFYAGTGADATGTDGDNKSVGISEIHTPSELHANLNKDDVVKYLVHMFDNSKGNVSLGFRSISKNIGLHEETARKVKGYLETIKVIESVGAKTHILCTKNEALERV